MATPAWPASPPPRLLHLGSGLGNGVANLHNARRAASPMVNIVGDHATYHAPYDAPLQSDIATIARNVSPWIDRPETPSGVARAGAEAVAAAQSPPGQVATLILPADASWGEGAAPADPIAPARRRTVPDDVVADVAKAVTSGDKTVVLCGGSALRGDGLRAATASPSAPGRWCWARRSRPVSSGGPACRRSIDCSTPDGGAGGQGHPDPDGAAGQGEPVVAWRAGCGTGRPEARRVRLVRHHAPVRHQGTHGLGHALGGQVPGRELGSRRLGNHRLHPGGNQIRQRHQRADGVVLRVREDVHGAA